MSFCYILKIYLSNYCYFFCISFLDVPGPVLPGGLLREETDIDLGHLRFPEGSETFIESADDPGGERLGPLPFGRA